MSVLVPILNEIHHIKYTAKAITDQEYCGMLEFLFIDGGSDDGTPEVLGRLARGDPRVRILTNPARRTPQAMNLGLEEARGDFIVWMSGHAYFPTNYVQTGIERLLKGDVDWVSGPALPQGSGRWSRKVALALGSRLGVGGSKFRRPVEGELEVDRGFAGAWRKQTLERAGGWDDRWSTNQDSELAARIRKSGGRIVCLQAMAAQYVPRNTLSGLWLQYWRYGKYRVRTSLAHPESMRPMHLSAPMLVLGCLAACGPQGRVGLLARAVPLTYGLMVAFVSSRQLFRSPHDALGLPVVFVTMHFSWGMGFFVGCVQYGVPARALAAVARNMLRELGIRVGLLSPTEPA